MRLCVGAVSQRVVEEAAKLQVHQVVASRRQVDVGGGYTGYDQTTLVDTVKRLSEGNTKVVRDHGGPLQGGTDDDGRASLDADVQAGFDGLHLDVCQLPYDRQVTELLELLETYGNLGLTIEIGGEHDTQEHNALLLGAALAFGVEIDYAVVGFGSRVWADRQYGAPTYAGKLMLTSARANALGVKTKIHNVDWVGGRVANYAGTVDAYNIAPEFGAVEIDALLTVLNSDVAYGLLEFAHKSKLWTRWFNANEGTWFDRAKCALRYLQWSSEVQDVTLSHDADQFVRMMIRDAIQRG